MCNCTSEFALRCLGLVGRLPFGGCSKYGLLVIDEGANHGAVGGFGDSRGKAVFPCETHCLLHHGLSALWRFDLAGVLLEAGGLVDVLATLSHQPYDLAVEA